MMYKIINNHTPEYLKSLIPPLVDHTTKYQLRNQCDIQVPTFRIKWHQNSFIPIGIELRNEIDNLIKNENSLSSFKALLYKRKYLGNLKQLKFRRNLFCISDRYWNMIHSKMRMNCSPLTEHLANSLHVIQNSTCDCGLSVEKNTHFLLECRLFTQHRQSMLNKIKDLPMITTDLLLYGDINLTFEQNKVIF